jgi:DNA polymerase-3 subunit beta
VKFRCERDTLVEALNTAARAVSGRGAVTAATNGVRIELRGNQLTVVGTDLDLTVQVEIEAIGLDDGVCVAPARLAADIVRAMEPGAITVDGGEDEVEISAARSRFVVRTYNVQEFPVLPDIRTEQAWLSSAGLAEGLRQVVRAASTDDTRPLLTGVLVSTEPTGVRLVATDSYRLAWRDLPGGTSLPDGTDQILVPARALNELQRLLAANAKDQPGRASKTQPEAAAGIDETLVASSVETDLGDAGTVVADPGTVQSTVADLPRNTGPSIGFSVGELDATFWVHGVRLTTRLLDGRFPDYRQLVPPEYPISVLVGKAVLVDALRRVRLLVKDNTTPVRMDVHQAGIDLSVMSQEIGQASETVDAQVEGDDVTVAFNPSYLIEGVEAAAGDEVLIEVVDATKPATVRAPNHDDYRYLLMPVRVS